MKSKWENRLLSECGPGGAGGAGVILIDGTNMKRVKQSASVQLSKNLIECADQLGAQKWLWRRTASEVVKIVCDSIPHTNTRRIVAYVMSSLIKSRGYKHKFDAQQLEQLLRECALYVRIVDIKRVGRVK